MNTERGFINMQFILSIPFLFIVLGGEFGGWLLSAEQKNKKTKEEPKMYKKLILAERQVIVHKGTEAPFSGE